MLAAKPSRYPCVYMGNGSARGTLDTAVQNFCTSDINWLVLNTVEMTYPWIHGLLLVLMRLSRIGCASAFAHLQTTESQLCIYDVDFWASIALWSIEYGAQQKVMILPHCLCCFASCWGNEYEEYQKNLEFRFSYAFIKHWYRNI